MMILDGLIDWFCDYKTNGYVCLFVKLAVADWWKRSTLLTGRSFWWISGSVWYTTSHYLRLHHSHCQAWGLVHCGQVGAARTHVLCVFCSMVSCGYWSLCHWLIWQQHQSVGHKYIAGTPQILLLLLPPSLFAFQRKNTNSSRIIFTIKNSRTAGGLLQELPAKQQTGIGANPPVFSFFFPPPFFLFLVFMVSEVVGSFSAAAVGCEN